MEASERAEWGRGFLSSSKSELDWVAAALGEKNEHKTRKKDKNYKSLSSDIGYKRQLRRKIKMSVSDERRQEGTRQRRCDEKRLQLADTGRSLSIKEGLCSPSWLKKGEGNGCRTLLARQHNSVWLMPRRQVSREHRCWLQLREKKEPAGRNFFLLFFGVCVCRV